MAEIVSTRYQTAPDSFHYDIFKDFRTFEALNYIQEVLNSNSHLSAIVNRQRQIILSNQHLVKIAGLENLEQIIGDRPGEILNCIHSTDKNVCGSSTSCKYCGIKRTIYTSQSQNKRVIGESRITARVDGKLMSYDFRVTCSPISFNGNQYTLLNLVDISSEKRNEILENVFFHDILNRLGAFSGIIQIMKSENKQSNLDEYIELLNTIGELVIEDIQTQRFLKAAENANLILNIREYSAFEIVESVRKQISFHPTMKSKQMLVCSECNDFNINTDSALLKRILLNMAKNAAEATQENGSIKILCTRKSGTALFSVNNKGVIPDNIRSQIFQRSFSTKGNGRGLGTYSMKLFGENYLKGKVYFRSNNKQGTTFIIELPLGH